MEPPETETERTSEILSERLPNRVSSSEIHLICDQLKSSIINQVLDKVPEITQIFNLAVVNEMKSEKSIYSGQVIDNLKWGVGFDLLSNGSCYYGEYENNLPNGKGLLVMNENQYYRGTFRNGKFDGTGEFRSDLNYYKGAWFKDLKHGFGEELVKGSLYKGFFEFGSRTGKGKLYYFEEKFTENVGEHELITSIKKFADVCYRGFFKDDVLDGVGEVKYMRHSDVLKVRGIFTKGTLSKGEIVFKDGSPIKKLAGSFDHGNFNSGEIFLKDGKVIQGVNTGNSNNGLSN